jgi:hypothetical protein
VGGGHCRTKWPTKVVGIATILVFDENYGILTVSCGPYMGHTLRLFYTFHLNKDTKNSFKKIPEIRIGQDKMPTD